MSTSNAEHRGLSNLRRATVFFGPARTAIATTLALAVGLVGLEAGEPLVLRRIFDALPEGNAERLTQGVVALIALALGREAMSAMSTWLTWRTRIGLQYRLTEATVAQLHRLPLAFHRTEGVGARMTRLDRSIQGLVGALAELAFHVVPSAIYLVLAAAIMLQLEWRLGLLVLAFSPLPVVVARLAAPVQTARERTLLERWVRIYGRFNEVLSGIVTVRSFAREHVEQQRFLAEVRDANEVVVRGVGVDAGVGVVQSLVQVAARVAALAIGGALVIRGDLTVGTLVAFLGYVGGLFGPVMGLANVYKTLRTATVSADEIYAILDAPDPLQDRPDAHEVDHVRGELAWRGVTFTHDVGDPPLLEAIDLTVRAGERVAIVGPSGAGKSTLIALLQRFHDPTEGAVLVDGVDVRTLKQVSLRRQIGLVSQDALLFDDTVRANIAYGRPDATDAEIEAAARAANAHDFIARLPEGYLTPAGERGGRFSVGERQRIAIARALLLDPAILVLDEPTSALDAASEAIVQQALDRLAAGRTTIVIAHRLSTVVDADRIVVLKDGRIVEEGRHAELVARSGYYAMLVEKQTHALLPVAA